MIDNMSSQQVDQQVNELIFDTEQYTLKSFTADDQTVNCRCYEKIVYVKYPVNVKFQRMNIYIPEAYFNGQSCGAFTAETAPVFLPNNVGGYMPAEPVIPGINRLSGEANAAFIALSKGYVVAAPAIRGRILRDRGGNFSGKAPACIVDLKAAVRFLHFNQHLIPADTSRIIVNGTSAGAALTALLGTTANHPDYEPYLEKLGAAQAMDDVFAVSAYSPITNLEYSDMAYEWQFNGIRNYHNIDISMLDYKVHREEDAGCLTDQHMTVSDQLKILFPAYLNGLKLQLPDGDELTLDENGDGLFKDYLKSLIIASAQAALLAGADLSAFEWVIIQQGQVVDMDFTRYIGYVGRMKIPPAFDALDLSSGENSLFGQATIEAQHFTRFALDHDAAGGSMADVAVVKLMNPMHYIFSRNASLARHWRIRHGTLDRDTSLAIPVILAVSLQQAGCDVDLALPWGRPHSGDYDLDELFNWIESIIDIQ